MKFIKETQIHAPPRTIFEFHELPDAFEMLIPPWEKARIIQRADISKIGSRAIIETKIFGLFPSRWVAEHSKYEPPTMFEDIQISGPFNSWRHQHIVLTTENGGILRDEIDFEPPLSFLGSFAAPILIVPKLEKMFEYRHKVTKEFCENL